jgi:hypothetical protein
MWGWESALETTTLTLNIGEVAKDGTNNTAR